MNSRVTTDSSGHLPAKAGETWRVSVRFSSLSTANKTLSVGLAETVTPFGETTVSDTSSGVGFICVERTVVNDCGLMVFVGNKSSAPGDVTIDSIVAERLIEPLGGLFSIGDSICYSAIDTGSVVNESQSYTNLFCLNNSIPFVNAGVGGETLSQCAARFSSQVGTPNTVFIEGGINDVNAASSDPNTSMRSAISSMVAAAKLIPSVKNICVFSITPHSTSVSEKKEWINTYNTWLESFASSQGIVFVHLSSILAINGVKISEYYPAGDSTHPNSAGHAAIVAYLQSVVLYSGDIINPTVTSSMRISKPQPAVNGSVDVIGNPVQYHGRAKLNLTQASMWNPDGIEILTVEQQQCDSGWIPTGESSISGGICWLYSSAGNLSRLDINGIKVVGKRYRLQLEFSKPTVGNFLIGNSGVEYLVTGPVSGTLNFEFTAIETGLTLKRSGICSVKFTNASLQELIYTPNPTSIVDHHTYSLADSHQMRSVTGWTYGTANAFYNADGTAKELTGLELKQAGIGPLLWIGDSKWLAFKSASEAKRALKVPVA